MSDFDDVRWDEASDAELGEVYLIETEAILANLDSAIELAKARMSRETIAEIRRSFHTLKGSGRMVGLEALGHAAWLVEELLNQWLDSDVEPTAAIIELAAAAKLQFQYWTEELKAEGKVYVDMHDILDAIVVVRYAFEAASAAAHPAPTATLLAPESANELPATAVGASAPSDLVSIKKKDLPESIVVDGEVITDPELIEYMLSLSAGTTDSFEGAEGGEGLAGEFDSILAGTEPQAAIDTEIHFSAFSEAQAQEEIQAVLREAEAATQSEADAFREPEPEADAFREPEPEADAFRESEAGSYEEPGNDSDLYDSNEQPSRSIRRPTVKETSSDSIIQRNMSSIILGAGIILSCLILTLVA